MSSHERNGHPAYQGGAPGWATLRPRETGKAVPLDRIVHDDAPGYLCAGYGGAPIPEWPFLVFIKLYLEGLEQESRCQWSEWLLMQFNMFGCLPKSKGGMYRGSVHRLAAEKARVGYAAALRNPRLLTTREIRVGIDALVRRRQRLVDSVRSYGYRSEFGDVIHAVKVGNLFVLKGGHHRAAALRQLGYEELPNVSVYTRNQWRMLQWLVSTKRALGLSGLQLSKSG